MGRLVTVTSMAALSLALTACAGSPTEKRWSCAPTKGAFRSCASIAEIDSRSDPQAAQSPGGVSLTTLTGAAPARGAKALLGVSGEAAPHREGDTVLRIMVAPWIDAVGDYHARSDIFAVVRRGGWTVPVPLPPPPPPPAAAESAP